MALTAHPRGDGTGEKPLLSKLAPPGLAVIVDPSPALESPLRTNALVFAETSERFFSERRLPTLLAGRHVDLAVVHSPRLFEQALSAVRSLAESCGPQSVVLLSGTVPIDETTQHSTRAAGFRTGDLWKTVLCLTTLRPDLQVFTIAAPPSGLTVIAGLVTTAPLLEAEYHEAIARYRELPYQELRGHEAEMLHLVENEPAVVEALLIAYRHRPDVLETV